MRLTIEIDCDNAAFGDDRGPEVFRILEPVIREWKLDGSPDWARKLRDTNGNTVGSVKVSE